MEKNTPHTQTHFERVEEIINQLSSAKACSSGVAANDDIFYTQFELPLDTLELSGGSFSPGMLHLLNAALNAHMPRSSATIANNHLYINISRKCEHLPEHGIHQGLRKLCHELLNATSERPDGYYVIDKARMIKIMPGMCHVDLEDLIHYLTDEYFHTHPKMHPEHRVLQSFYQLPDKKVFIDPAGQHHHGIVGNHIYGKFATAYAEETGLPIAFCESEARTALNSPLLAALIATLDTGERGRTY